MQVSVPYKNDSLGGRKNSPYSTIFSILRKDSNDVNDIYILGKCVEEYLLSKVKVEFMACVGSILDKDLVYLISEFYNKFQVDIPIINSILITHGYKTIYYKEALQLSLDTLYFTKDEQVLKLYKSVFEQFPSLDEVNLINYIKILGIKNSIMVAIYDFNQKSYIYNELHKLLDKKVKRNPEIIWETYNTARIY
jgi:hypothetical protein